MPPPQVPRPEAFVARVARQDGRLLDVRRAWTGAPSDVREIIVGAGGVLTIVARDAWSSPPRDRSVLARYDAGGVQAWHRTTPGEAFEWTAVASARSVVFAAGQLRTTADVGGGVMPKRSTTGDLVIVGGVR